MKRNIFRRHGFNHRHIDNFHDALDLFILLVNECHILLNGYSSLAVYYDYSTKLPYFTPEEIRDGDRLLAEAKKVVEETDDFGGEFGTLLTAGCEPMGFDINWYESDRSFETRWAKYGHESKWLPWLKENYDAFGNFIGQTSDEKNRLEQEEMRANIAAAKAKCQAAKDKATPHDQN